MPPKPEFTSTISWGQMIQVIVLLLGFASTFAVMQYRTSAAYEALSEAQDDRAKIEIRLRAVETQQARADERFSSIMSLLGRIDSRLERIERQ